MKQNIGIIGGGAAGLTAAIAAARQGAAVTIYERCDRLAKKILATGNGRCNLTNRNASLKHYHGEQPKFIKSAMSQFWVEEVLAFFSELGILTKTEAEEKVFPYSFQAAAISEVLRFEAERLGVKVKCNFEAADIQKNRNTFTIRSYSNETATADRVILTCGGKASPNLGSNGSGYTLARGFGHTITPLFPSLVQVKTDNTYTKGLQGVKINGTAGFYRKDTLLSEYSGEILFTDYGLSGPPIFNLSRLASVIKNGEIHLDLMPEFSHDELTALLTSRKNADKLLEIFLIGIFPKTLGQILLKACGISPLSRKSNTLTEKEIFELTQKIKAWHFPVLGTRSWNNAQVTAGGIDVREVDPSTMQSKLAKGLYLAGEILDIDGDCGGYNLQWAWSSGYIAGHHAAGAEEHDD